MDCTLAALLSLHAFSTGRRIFAVGLVQLAADKIGFTALSTHCDAALAHDRQTLVLEARWATDKDASQYAPEAREADVLVDVALGALQDSIAAEARDSAPGDPVGEAAAKLLAQLFPKGAAAITTLAYPEELAQVQRILAVLGSADWSPLVDKLGLSRRVSRLTELEKQYREAIALPSQSVTFAQVKAARSRGQGLMLQAVAMSLGKYPSDDEADVTARAALIRPILEQDAAIHVYLRERRAVEDVDPATGQVSGTPAAGATSPTPAATTPAAGAASPNPTATTPAAGATTPNPAATTPATGATSTTPAATTPAAAPTPTDPAAGHS